ncbi:AAA family ATPase [Miniimonas arenae]|uniref:AAA family ATPase n=1 Tax=Miniimonas arenae TaxID=676201 RepID=UPI0028B039A9|nr:ATP-binding protein [Miniimonas arenae]
MPRVVLMCGISGSGKSTAARTLVDQGWVRLSTDDAAWRRGVRTFPVSAALAEELEGEQRTALLDLVRAGRDVVVDAPFATRALRSEYRALLEAVGVTPEVWFVVVDAEVAVRRLAGRGSAGPDDVRVAEDAARALVAGFEPPTTAEGPLAVVRGDEGNGPVGG